MSSFTDNTNHKMISCLNSAITKLCTLYRNAYTVQKCLHCTEMHTLYGNAYTVQKCIHCTEMHTLYIHTVYGTMSSIITLVVLFLNYPTLNSIAYF